MAKVEKVAGEKHEGEVKQKPSASKAGPLREERQPSLELPADIKPHVKDLRKCLEYSSESFSDPIPQYVAWIDVMGAGSVMSWSMHQSANRLMRLHGAVAFSISALNLKSVSTIPINDGTYIFAESKRDIMSVVRQALTLLAGNFLGRPAPHDRFLVRSAIAYGPVHRGSYLANGFVTNDQKNAMKEAVKQISFGPPIAQAHDSERQAPPFGVAIHESARSFSPAGERPFQTVLWQWWSSNDDGKFLPGAFQTAPKLVKPLRHHLLDHIKWLEDTTVWNGLSSDRLAHYATQVRQYFPN